MWADFLRFLPADGVPLREVSDLVPLTNLAGLERWGYVTVGPGPADSGPAPPRRDHVVRPTRWGPSGPADLGAADRRDLGSAGGSGSAPRRVDQLTSALRAVGGPPGDAWPPFLPVSGVHGAEPGRGQPAVSAEHRVAGADLATLMARALMSFRAEFEPGSAVPLPVSANVLRVLTAGGVALRDVPRRAGISKEAVSVSAGLAGAPRLCGERAGPGGRPSPARPAHAAG